MKLRRLFACPAVVLAGCADPGPTSATGALPVTKPFEIVALGASNTEGRGRGRTPDGVAPDQAFPAQLQRLLDSQRCHARVLNAGRAGDSTGQMLQRLPGVVERGTRVVILQPGGNDERRGSGGDTAANIEALQRAVTERGAKVVMLEDLEQIAGPDRLPDGQHFSADGHARFAAYLAPRVRAAGACDP